MEPRSESEARNWKSISNAEKEAFVKELLIQYAGRKMETHNRLERLVALRQADERKGTSFAVDYTQQITPRIQENKRFLDGIEKAVQKIADPLEREVLQMRYMDGNACRLTGWKEVAFQLYQDDSAANVTAAHRLHRKALHTLAAILESEGANE